MIYRYSLKVPYTSFRNDKEFKSIPYTVKERVKVGCKKLVKNECKEPIMANKSVTKYKSVSNNVLVKETKLRTEYQTLNYPATEHEVKAKIKARVATKNAEYSNLYKYDNKFIEHYASFDKAKLRPSLFKGDGLLKFKKDSLMSLSHGIIKKYERLWESKYCSNTVKKGEKSLEQVFRCLASNPTNKKAAAWFIGNFGLNYNRGLSLMQTPLEIRAH